MDYLSLFYHVLHLALIGFVLFGWMFRRLRKANLIIVLIIWLSWVGAGWYVGYIGYCPLTDLHWQHLHHVALMQGEIVRLPPSYIEYLLWQVGSGDIADKAVSYSVAGIFVCITIISLYQNYSRKPRSD